LSDTLDLFSFLDQDNLACELANKFQTWSNQRSKWLDDKREIQEYIFSTSTSTTTNQSLPWKNKVHIPKLCQIRDNLHANYMAALFPNDDAIAWEGDDESAESTEKRQVIEAYMKNKMRQARFRTEVSRLVLDFIDYGNVFAMGVFEADYHKDPQTGEDVPKYIGPRLVRIDPRDIVFDPTSTAWEKTPKIIQRMMTTGSLKKDIEIHPEFKYQEQIFSKAITKRRELRKYSPKDFGKNVGFEIAGVGWWDHFQSDTVEILDFYGDYYDIENDKLYENHLISVVDRSWIIRNEPLSNWSGMPPIRHAGWRVRQDNLYAMGPLDNLVGLQHRIDHLENAKADAFDLIVHPVMKVNGFVEDFEYGPGERIYAGEEGDVVFMQPDTTFLQADTQIAMYEQKMEEMAGAPKQALGFRTPGEKTAYEVQILENGANRVFINKTSYFEEMFLEPILNDMLELARRNLNEADTIRVLDSATQAVTFDKITKEDITARGKIRPIGARHFAQNATVVQNITQFANSALGQNPLITAHMSGKKLAHALQNLLNLEKYDIVQDYIGLYEQAEMQQIASSLQQVHMEQQTAGMDPQQAQQAVAGMMAQQQEQGKKSGSGSSPGGELGLAG
jgi:hypothetical protein